MRMFYLSRKAAALAGLYLMAAALLIAGAGMALPRAEPALAEPYRSGPPQSAMVSLAINVDWGEEYLPAMLEILAAHNIKASFFLTGRWADNNPELAKTIYDAGHEIGNHGYSHASPNASSVEEIVDEIDRTKEAVSKACGIDTSLYAPPSGECEDHVLQAAEQAGHTVILWSVDTIDWQKPDAATVVQRVTGKIHGGAIILAHPTACTTEALPTIISELSAEGYHFVTVSQNLGL